MKHDYFLLANQLNIKYNEILLEKQAHFRGNPNSCSLVSLNNKTPEIGISGITEKNAAEKLFHFNPLPPKRKTPEKILQARIILHTMHNNGILPMAEGLTWITSEFAALHEGRKIVNDILAIDPDNNLAVIELKSTRSAKVMQQALAFKDFVLKNPDYFNELTQLITHKNWNGQVRAIAVWPKATNKGRTVKYKVEIFAYDDQFSFYPEKTK